ncbi:hypothetical protein V5799_029779 [Amblyomma americanum]|uniref:Uncharacterized protein n=1 Tax=Amblyomma americanum TaxID=6943 RepID=A0AAQ4EQL4_AMBAM
MTQSLSPTGDSARSGPLPPLVASLLALVSVLLVVLLLVVLKDTRAMQMSSTATYSRTLKNATRSVVNTTGPQMLPGSTPVAPRQGQRTVERVDRTYRILTSPPPLNLGHNPSPESP